MSAVRRDCQVIVHPDAGGGMTVSLVVPCSDRDARFVLSAERDNDGDWRVFIPWPNDEDDDRIALIDGMEVSNGILYLAASGQ